MSFEAAAMTNLVAWALYIMVFAANLSTRKRSERRGDSKLLVGALFQVAAPLVLPAFLRPPGSPLVPADWAYGELLEQVVRVVAVLLEFGSVWLTFAAIRTLGKQWALSARVVRDHELIRTGPYGLVRHPIYTGALGITIATALTATRWEAVIIAAALSLLGAWIRVRSEEKLLRETFGSEYARYAQLVPAIIPGLRLHRARNG